MKKLMPQVILALLLIAFNFSCKKTTEQNQQLLNSNQLEVKDGVITFNTSADFREAMLHFQQYSPAILQDKVKRLNGFKSILGLNPNTARNNSTNSAARLVIDDTPPSRAYFF